MNHYEILGIPMDATSEEIKFSFRNLSKKYHPDISKEPSVDYVLILEAYKILIDENKRRKYDSENSEELVKYRVKTANLNSRYFILPYDRIEYSFSLENILRNGIRFLKYFKHDDYIDHLGQDIIIYIKPFELKLGSAAVIEIPARSPCLVCRGSDPGCYRCSGKGFVKSVEKLIYKIPQSARNGDILELNPETATPAGKSFLSYRMKTVRIRIVFID